MGMHPRFIQANRVYAQTQRTIDRQFLFQPDPVVRNIIGAAAVRAQKNHPVKILWLDFKIKSLSAIYLGDIYVGTPRIAPKRWTLINADNLSIVQRSIQQRAYGLILH